MPPQKKQRTHTNEKEVSNAGLKARAAAARSNGKTRKALKKERRPRGSGRPRGPAGTPSTRRAASARNSPLANPDSSVRMGVSLTPEPPSRVALPGDMYQRTGQWWWRVRLPGEDKAKARPLKETGAREATSDRNTAEKIAIAMWEHAVMQYGTRQVAFEYTAKVERLKAQFLDKVRQLTEIVNSATAKAEAEVQARAEAEAKLNALLQAAGQRDASRPAETPAAAQEPAPIETSVPVCESPCPSVPCAPPQPVEPAGLGASLPGGKDTHPIAQDVASEIPDRHKVTESVCAAPPAPPIEITHPEPELSTDDCECCGAAGIPTTDLVRIDSGQRLCPDCLHAFRFDVARLEATA